MRRLQHTTAIARGVWNVLIILTMHRAGIATCVRAIPWLCPRRDSLRPIVAPNLALGPARRKKNTMQSGFVLRGFRPFGGSSRRGPPRGRPATSAAALLNPHKVLGLDSATASEADIKKAYRRLAKAHHPDLNGGSVEAERKFVTIQQAYDILIGKARGKEIDASAGGAPSEGGWDFHDWCAAVCADGTVHCFHLHCPASCAMRATATKPMHYPSVAKMISSYASLRLTAAIRAVPQVLELQT